MGQVSARGRGGGGGETSFKNRQIQTREKCIFILCSKPDQTSRHTLCLKRKTECHV